MNDLLPNTDNFFKYLLTIGLLLIAFSILYPLQKQKEVDIEILNAQLKTQILTLEIKNLKEKVEVLKVKKNDYQGMIDNLKILKSNSSYNADSIEQIRQNLAADFNDSKQILISITDSLERVNTSLGFDKIRIKKLEGYYIVFKKFKTILVIFGTLLSLIGLVYWAESVYLDERNKGNKIAPEYKSLFIRSIDWCKALPLVIWLTLIITFLILILFILFQI